MNMAFIIELLRRLGSRGIGLRAEGDNLRIDAPKGVMDASLREELSSRKAEILNFLTESAECCREGAMPLRRISAAASCLCPSLRRDYGSCTRWTRISSPTI